MIGGQVKVNNNMRNIKRTVTLSGLLLGAIIHAYMLKAREDNYHSALIIQQEFGTGITTLDWNSDSTLLAIVDGNDTVSIFDIRSGEVEVRLEDEVFLVRSLAWSPVSQQLLIASNTTRLWNSEKDDWDNDFEFPSALESPEFTPVGNVDWNPDGERLALVLRECTGKSPERPGARVEIWNILRRTSSQIGDCIERGFGIVKWNPQGTHIAISGVQSAQDIFEEVEIWDGDTGEKCLSIQELKDTYDLTWGPQGDMVALATTAQNNVPVIQIRDAITGEIITQMDVSLGVYAPLDWHPSENLLVTGGQDGAVRIWDTSTGRELIVLDDHTDTINDVAWSPDGTMLATVGRDGKLFVWRTSALLERVMHFEP